MLSYQYRRQRGQHTPDHRGEGSEPKQGPSSAGREEFHYVGDRSREAD